MNTNSYENIENIETHISSTKKNSESSNVLWGYPNFYKLDWVSKIKLR